MTHESLRILIEQGESTTLEFKENFSASFAREVVALANTIGGKVLVGVSDGGKIVGVRDSNTLRARIQDVARNCDPPVRVLVEPVAAILVVHVSESDFKPVQCSDGFFWRQGAATQKMNRDELRDFFRQEGSIRFDLSICTRFNYPEDFDHQKFETWLRLSSVSRETTVEEILVNIGAAEWANRRLQFRNAGVLLFAKNVRHFLPHSYITCLLARATDKADILDRKDFEGGLVADIEDALRFISRNTRTAYEIKSLIRKNIPEYPPDVLREAITNAVMHRDWFIEGANVFVEIYSDRIEISNPAGLPQILSLGDLGRRSVRRNPLIADLFHRINFIENAGNGIQRMRNEMRAQGCPEPEFAMDRFFVATLRPNPAVRDVGATDRTATEPRTDVDTRVATVDRLLQVVSGEMTSRHLRRALCLKNADHFRKAYLIPALRSGLLEMTIPGKPRSKNQRYRLSKTGREFLMSQTAQENPPMGAAG